MPAHAFTIRKLADAAGVGVEAVRFYQRRGLLSQPERRGGGFREYAPGDVKRLQFIKRAQELGFSLDDVAELLALDAGTDQRRAREISQRRVAQIRERVVHLNQMADALQRLVGSCERSVSTAPCAIIDALVAKPVVVPTQVKVRRQSCPSRSSTALRRVAARA